MYTFYRKHIYISCWKLWIFCASMVRWSLLIHQDPPGSTCPAIGPEMEDSLVLHPVSPWQQTWGFHMETLAESGRTVGHPSFEPGKTMDKLLKRLFDGLCCSMGFTPPSLNDNIFDNLFYLFWTEAVPHFQVFQAKPYKHPLKDVQSSCLWTTTDIL